MTRYLYQMYQLFPYHQYYQEMSIHNETWSKAPVPKFVMIEMDHILFQKRDRNRHNALQDTVSSCCQKVADGCVQVKSDFYTLNHVVACMVEEFIKKGNYVMVYSARTP